jgi:hypothetical protein
MQKSWKVKITVKVSFPKLFNFQQYLDYFFLIRDMFDLIVDYFDCPIKNQCEIKSVTVDILTVYLNMLIFYFTLPYFN